MNRWILQMGFPVVTIDTKTGKITQKHFLLDPDSVVDRPSEFKWELLLNVSVNMLNIQYVSVILNSPTLFFILFFEWLDGCGSSYEWFVPITWIKTGVERQQYWLVDKEGKIYHRLFRAV